MLDQAAATDDVTRNRAAKAPSKAGKVVVQILSALAGWGIAQYFGVGLLLIPGLAWLATYAVAALVHRHHHPLVHVASLQIAHLAWFTAAIVVVRAPLLLVDILLLGGLLLWLLLRPGLLSASFLAGANLLFTIYNAFQLLSIDATMVKALMLHIVLRLSIVAALVYGIRALERETDAPFAPAEVAIDLVEGA